MLTVLVFCCKTDKLVDVHYCETDDTDRMVATLEDMYGPMFDVIVEDC